MTNIQDSLNAAMAHHRGGNLAEAERIYRQVLEAQPDQPDALHLLGLIAHQVGRQDDAIGLIGRAIARQPAAADYHNNLGEAHRARGNLGEALACYERAVALNPQFPEAHLNLGVAHAERGDLDRAEAHYRQAVASRPGYPQALNNLGNILSGRGLLEEAIAVLGQAVAAQPDFAEAHNNLGTVLKDSGRLEEAARHYRTALKLKPDFAPAISNLGAIHFDLRQMAEAIECFRRALAAPAPPTGVWVNLGKALNEQGRWQEAEAAYRRALEVEPGAAAELRLACAVPVIAESAVEFAVARCRLSERIDGLLASEPVIKDPLSEVNSVSFYLAYQGVNDRDLQVRMSRLYEKACPSLAFRADHCAGPRPAAAGRPIRIGFVARLIGQQSVARVLMSGIMKSLSRQTFSVQVFSFPHPRNAEYAQIAAAADRVTLVPSVLDAARKVIAAQELDVLCYVDIGMDPVTYFLAFSRLAPVQCATWQHPVTTGIHAVDYYISSELFEPDGAQEHYSERLVLLKHLPTFYARPPSPAPLKSRRDLGLDEARTVYLCPQSLFKMHPDFDSVLEGVLRGDPDGIVYLIEGLERNWTEIVLRRLRRTVPGVVDRIRFVPRVPTQDFPHLLAVADVILDPLYWSGGITSLDALAFGTPIVTLPGSLMRGRVTYGCYRQMGMLDCVAASPEDYVALAVRLGRDRAFRESVRQKILAANAVLYENMDAVRDFEQFFAAAVNSPGNR